MKLPIGGFTVTIIRSNSGTNSSQSLFSQASDPVVVDREMKVSKFTFTLLLITRHRSKSVVSLC